MSLIEFQRQPFNGGVCYSSPTHPHIAVVGYYGPDQLEHECTYWELHAPGYPAHEGFFMAEDAMRIAEDFK